MEEHYQKIYTYYKEFELHLLSNGMLPAKDTDIGYWGVTYIPAAYELFQKLNLKDKTLLDLGSGDGRIAFLASIFGCKVHAIEFDNWLHETALHIQQELLENNIRHAKNVDLFKKDFLHHPLTEYDYIYISPDKPFFRSGLNPKLKQELKGKLIVHGWEFFPESLKLEKEEIIDGEKFRIYSN